MKSIINTILRVRILLLLIVLGSCDTDFPNPNASTEEEALSSRDGLFAVAVGIQQSYSTDALRWIIETPAITTREVAISSTFQNLIELEDGGAPLPNFNSSVEGFWSDLYPVIYSAEQLVEAAESVSLIDGTRTGLIAYANLFRAMSVGYLANNFEQVVLQTSSDGNAQFASRQAAYDQAIAWLEEARSAINTTAPSDEFLNAVSGADDIDLGNTIDAMLARYNLLAGNYDAAITAANRVDLSSASVFRFDAQNINPIWRVAFEGGNNNFKPQDNFGLPASFTFDPNDGRISFYTTESDETNINGYPIDELTGFFTSGTSSMPVYLPGEISLIVAEANVRKASPDLNAAVEAINVVREKTDDPFGINADIGSYAGAVEAGADRKSVV